MDRYNVVSQLLPPCGEEPDPEKCKPPPSISREKMGTAVRQVQEAGFSDEAGSMSCCTL